MRPLLSHPDKLLEDHLREVANIAVTNFTRKVYSFDIFPQDIDGTRLVADLIYIAAVTHDVGKATSFFQDYIRMPEKTHNQLKNHALLSSLFAYFIAKKYLEKIELDSILKKLFSVFVFTSVKRHHGNLGNLSDELFFGEWEESLSIQINHIEKTQIEPLLNTLLEKIKIRFKWDDFAIFVINKKYADLFEDYSFDLIDDELPELDKKIRLEMYYIHQLIYSNLLYADKQDVILQKKIEKPLQKNIVREIAQYRKEKHFDKPKNGIDKLKNKAYFDSLQNLEKVFKSERHIYSLTLPTGIGKTITAYAVADKIRKLIAFEDSEIIINIPFTSIIDQNFEVYKEILKSKDSETLLKHHHLSEPVYKPANEDVLNYDKSSFLIETWQSDTIVTTFVQLLETVLTADKAKLMKLSHLANSVILLDEIQSINYDLWDTVRESFKMLGQMFNIYFVLISATQPLIFTPDEDVIEIVPDYRGYFRIFNRTKLILKRDVIGFDDFKKKVIEYLNYNEKDTLIILNTKDAARACFEYLSDILDENIELYYLSTLITPYERKEIIKRIKEPSEHQKVIVSTQLVEAGVDISVDTVFRQFAPLDSIIQAAGRANRYNEKKYISEIFIFNIEELSRSSSLIYGADLLLKTNNVLKNFENEIEEKDYLKLIELYFKEVRGQADQTTQIHLKNMLGLNFAEVNKFELIKNERKTELVYIQLTERAKEIWGKYNSIYSDGQLNLFEKRAAFSKIKSEFYDYVINVPVPFGQTQIDFDREKIFNFYLSPLVNPSRNYCYSDTDFRQNRGYIKSGSVISF